MSQYLKNLDCWKASIEESQNRTVKIDTKEEIHDLFNRAAFGGERIIMKSDDASFAIVPIEDVLLLNKQGL